MTNKNGKMNKDKDDSDDLNDSDMEKNNIHNSR